MHAYTARHRTIEYKYIFTCMYICIANGIAIAARAKWKFMRCRPWKLCYSFFNHSLVGCGFWSEGVICSTVTVGWSLVNFGTFHDYYLHSAIIEGHCLIFICVYFISKLSTQQFPFTFSVSLRGYADGTPPGEALEATLPVGLVSLGEAATN